MNRGKPTQALIRSLTFALATVAATPAMAWESSHDVERICRQAEPHANYRLRNQIQNYRLVYSLSLAMTDRQGRLLDPLATIRARNNLIEVCSLAPRQYPAG